MKSSDIPKFGALSGVKVVCSGMAVAGPFAASLMSDFGADVINIENAMAKDPARAGSGACFEQDHRNQRAIALNIPTPEGKEILLKLLKNADVFIENSKGGQYAKWGLTDEVLWGVNPALVIVHVSGYGQSGVPEYIEKPSWDAIGQAFGTIVAMNGIEEAPMASNPFMCDWITALNAAYGAVVALFRAKMTGEGESIDIAQFEVMLRGQAGLPLEWFLTGKQPRRTGNNNVMASAFKPFKCKDGFVYIAMVGPGVMEDGLRFFGFEFGSDLFPKDIPWSMQGSEGGRLLEEEISEYCIGKTVEEVDRELGAVGIPISPVMDYESAAKNEHYRTREVFTEWEGIDGQNIKGVNILPKMKNAPGMIWRGAPKYGMDNDDILDELGYTTEQIQKFYDRKVLSKDS